MDHPDDGTGELFAEIERHMNDAVRNEAIDTRNRLFVDGIILGAAASLVFAGWGRNLIFATAGCVVAVLAAIDAGTRVAGWWQLTRMMRRHSRVSLGRPYAARYHDTDSSGPDDSGDGDNGGSQLANP